jgi:hypothetical protein
MGCAGFKIIRSPSSTVNPQKIEFSEVAAQ